MRSGGYSFFLFFCSPLRTLLYTHCIPGAAPGRPSFDEYICFYPSKKWLRILQSMIEGGML